MIIDTDVLIWEFQSNLQAKKAIHSNIPFNISVVTYMEIVQGMRNKAELNKFIKQITKWNVQILQLNSEVSTRAMIYVEEYFLSHSMELVDSLIAATCIYNSDILLTGNVKHYKHIPNIQLLKFDPESGV